MFSKFINEEECHVLFGKVVGRIWFAALDQYSIGETSRVGFDPDYVFNNRSKTVGWVHSHPFTKASASMTDDTTTKAWVCSIGKPLVCCIQGIDGLRAHWYFDDEAPAVEGRVYRVGKRLFGVVPQWQKHSHMK